MSDPIERQAAIDAMMALLGRVPTNAIRAKDALEKLPSAQPEPLTVTIDLSKDECDRLKQAMRDTPIMLLPSAGPDRCDTCRFVYYPKEINNNDQ